MVCFIVTTGIMDIAAKLKGYTPVGVHIKSKWSINLDIRFFSDFRNGFIAMGKPKIIPLINQISIYVLIIGWLLVILSIFAQYY